MKNDVHTLKMTKGLVKNSQNNKYLKKTKKETVRAQEKLNKNFQNISYI